MKVKNDHPNKEGTPVGNEILAYLLTHPRARDTVEGILTWWLLEQTIIFKEMQVKKALSELVLKGFVVAKKGADSKVHYRVNQNRIEDVRQMVEFIGD